MTTPPKLLDVGRRLSLSGDNLTDDNAEELLAQVEGGLGRESDWSDALKRRICFLIGRANTGKTSELTLLHSRMRTEGKLAFLLALRTIFERRTLDELFASREDAEEFRRWNESNEEAVFLLDSIDEADLFRDGAFSECLAVLRRLLGDALLKRARWVISSRPGAWSSSRVAMLVRQELCPDAQYSAGEVEAEADAAMESSETLPEADVLFAALRPLSRRQAARFLREVYGATETSEAEDLAHNLGLSFAMESPGDLKWFAPLLTVSPRPTSRLRAFDAAARKLVTARTTEMMVGLDDVLGEVERICAASILCEVGLFALREAETAEGSLPLSELIGHRNYAFERMLRALPLTSDAGLQRIKFVPEHVQSFLAARWLASRAHSTAEQVELLDLFRRESLAGPLVPWKLLVCAGWLTARLHDFRRSMLEFAPHAVTFLGDFAELTLEECRVALEKTMQALSKGHPLLPNTLHLTRDDYWHIARPDMGGALAGVFQKYCEHEACAEHLLSVFASRRVPEVAPLLREYFQRAESQSMRLQALNALEESGEPKDVEWAARDELNKEAVDDELARAFASAILRSGGAESLFVEACSRSSQDWSSYLYSLRDAAEDAADERGLRYASALLREFFKAPISKDESDEESPDSQETDAIAIVLALLKGVLSRESVTREGILEAIDVLELVRGVPSHHGGYERFEDFPEIVEKVPGFRRLALQRLSKELLPSDAFRLQRGARLLYVEFDNRDLGLVEELKSKTQVSTEAELLDALLSRLSPPPPAIAREIPPRNNAALNDHEKSNRKAINEDLESIRDCKDLRKVSSAAYLALDRRTSRYGKADWSKFSRLYGEEAASALKAGVEKLWRAQPPVFDPQATNSTFHQTIAGLIGLGSELSREGACHLLSEEEAERAFVYSKFELNQFPEWVSELASSFPDAFDRFIRSTIVSWNESPLAKQHAYQVMERVSRDRTASVSFEAAQVTWTALLQGAWDGRYTLGRALDLVARHAKHLEPSFLAVAARNTETFWAMDSDYDLFPQWFEHWLGQAPLVAIAWLGDKCKGESSECARKMVHLASHFYSSGFGGAFENAAAQEKCAVYSGLYLLLLRAIPPAPVAQPEPTPVDHDQAALVRDTLLGRIAHVGGIAAYTALYQLATRVDVRVNEMRWLHRLAFEVAEGAATGAPWTVADFAGYSRNSAIPLLDAESLWKAVRRDLDESIRNLQTGEFNPRRMLLCGEERDMQLWMARELELLGLSRYKVVRELELANGTTPDLTALSPAGCQAVLELKLGDKRSTERLLRDLSAQLHDDYMQSEHSSFGLFVVMWKDQGAARRAALLRKVQSVSKVLNSAAERLSADSGGLKHIAVRCFICPQPKSERNEKRTAKTSRSSSRQSPS